MDLNTDLDFDHEALQPLFPLSAEDWANMFEADVSASTAADTFGINPAGRMAPDLGLDFADSLGEEIQPGSFDFELLDAMSFDFDPLGGESLGCEFGRPQDSSSTFASDNPQVIFESLPFRQRADVGPSDNMALVAERGENSAMSYVAPSNPRQEQMEW